MSLPADDVEFLDAYTKSRGHRSRSAVLHVAITLLRATELGRAYEEAWQEWTVTDDAEDWDRIVTDGIASR